MKKIILKTMTIISACAILVFSFFSIASIRWTSNVLTGTIEQRTLFEASKCANAMSMILKNAEGMVDTLYSQATNEFDINRYEQEYTAYIADYIEEFSPVMHDALQEVDHAAGVFFTFNPELSNYTECYEIWYAFDDNDEITPQDATANGIFLEAFYDYDAPNMQYYFRAEDNPDSGVWIESVYDTDIGEETLEYSRAVYIDDVFIGVVGVDIFTAQAKKIIAEMDVENNGIIVLLDTDGDEILSSHNSEEIDLTDIWDTYRRDITDSDEGTLHCSDGDIDNLINYSKLCNGWTLAIIDDEAVVLQPVRYVRIITVIMAIFLTLADIIIAYIALNRFYNPVKKAAEMLRMIDTDESTISEKTLSLTNDDDIEQLVRRQIQKQREKDIIVAHQSRLAQMGEMLSNITHQWKGPLNKLSLILGMMRDDKAYGELTDEKFDAAIGRAEEIINSMSATINDFRSYLSPDAAKEFFSVPDTIDSVLSLLEDKFKVNRIILRTDYEKNCYAYGYKNALYHVILNVIDNAADALIDNAEDDKCIDILVCGIPDTENIKIEIFNSGGNIPQEMLGRIFTPYVSTKENGSGLGLSISKSLIEESMDGSITLANVDNGVICTIILKGNQNE